MADEYHVSKNGVAGNSGTKEKPFLTINEAAQIAAAGNTIIIHEGECKEWVNLKEGGLSNNRRITYMAAEGEQVVIKGSERVNNWESEGGGLWKRTAMKST